MHRNWARRSIGPNWRIPGFRRSGRAEDHRSVAATHHWMDLRRPVFPWRVCEANLAVSANRMFPPFDEFATVPQLLSKSIL